MLPEVYKTRSENIPYSGTYSCSTCGFTTLLEPETAICTVCKHEEWVPSIQSPRIS